MRGGWFERDGGARGRARGDGRRSVGAGAVSSASLAGKRSRPRGEGRRAEEQHQQRHSGLAHRGGFRRGESSSQIGRMLNTRIKKDKGGGRGQGERRRQGPQKQPRYTAAPAAADDDEIPSDDEGVEGAADSEDYDLQQRRSGQEEEVEEEDGGGKAEDEDERRVRLARAFLRQLATKGGFTRGAAGREEDKEKRVFGAFAAAADEARSGEEDEEEEEEDDEQGEGGGAGKNSALAALLKSRAEARSPHAFRETPESLRMRFKVFLRGHKLPVTCVASPGMGDASEQQQQQLNFSSNFSAAASLDRHIYTGGKDCCVVRWDLQEEKKTVFRGKRNDFHCGGHFRPILGLCVPPDESFFCSVGGDQLLRIWDHRTSTTKCVAALRGHTGAICSVKLNNWPSAGAGGGTGSSFFAGTQSFSSAGDIEVITCGADKSIKLWNLSLRACLNSYFGHTAVITAMDVMQPNRPLTVGDDFTARSWKLVQDTHLVFSPQLTPVDSCCYLTPSLFACGTQGGVISLYSTLQKKPLAAVQLRPRLAKRSALFGDTNTSKRGIAAMAALRRSEIFFTASEGGAVQLWRAKRRRRKAKGTEEDDQPCGGAGAASLQLGSSVQMTGVVTSLCLTPSENSLVAAVSKESRLGRWLVDKEARNGIALFSLADADVKDHSLNDAMEDTD